MSSTQIIAKTNYFHFFLLLTKSVFLNNNQNLLSYFNEEKKFLVFSLTRGYNARKVICSCVNSAYIWAEFIVNRNRCISVRLVSEEVKLKALDLDNFDNWHNSFL